MKGDPFLLFWSYLTSRHFFGYVWIVESSLMNITSASQTYLYGLCLLLTDATVFRCLKNTFSLQPGISVTYQTEADLRVFIFFLADKASSALFLLNCHTSYYNSIIIDPWIWFQLYHDCFGCEFEFYVTY